MKTSKKKGLGRHSFREAKIMSNVGRKERGGAKRVDEGYSFPSNCQKSMGGTEPAIKGAILGGLRGVEEGQGGPLLHFLHH